MGACSVMAKSYSSKDLFGKPIRQRRPRYEAALERGDKAALPSRAARIRWLAQVMPRGAFWGMPIETHCVFEEAKSSFVYENFVAAIVLSAAFVEHWLVSSLGARGYEKEAAQGLAAAIRVARENKFVDTLVLDKADELRLIRNPFVHLKSFDHEHTLTQRAFKQKTYPHALLEADAKNALIAMYGVALYAFRHK